ncbi:MAG: glycosyltransferase family 39 protein [Woeseiaceae bacterium]
MFRDSLDNKKEVQLLLKAFIIVFIIRLIISIYLPITGDEAYFVVWGNNLDYGYYDHPPFVGWLLAAFLTISDALWWLRLPSTLLPIFLSYGIYHILKLQQPKIAVWVALTFLVAPVNIINILITTDTPLMFFSFISAWSFYLALSSSNEGENQYKLFMLAGLFLGLAFFSKYFAVFLGVTYGLYIVIFHRTRKGFTGLAVILLMALPFVVINLLWNYNNCWSNVVFNLYNRIGGENNSLTNLYKYVIVLVYLYSPVLIYFLIRNRSKYFLRSKSSQVFLWLTVIPLALFLVVAIRKTIGLHWLLSFYPFAFIAFSSFLNIKQWRINFYFMLFIGSIHLIGIASILILPVTTFTSDKFLMQDYYFGMYPSKFLEKLKIYEKDYTFGMTSYSRASVASYYSNKRFIVFSEGSVHARTDDKLTNYKDLDGKNIMLINRSKENMEVHERYFKSSERKGLEVDGVRFELLLGRGFKYDLYRKEILPAINKKYYNIPDWLPIGQCHIKERYDLE